MEQNDAWRLTDRLHAAPGKGDPFAAAVRGTRMPMIITDPRQHDNPIVYVNEAFLALSGYGRDEIMGRNCRFLQGPDTDRAAVERIREAVQAERDIAVDLLNYRKDGTPFWNALYLSPVPNEAGEVLYFFASQLDVTDRIDAHLKTQAEKALVEREVARRTRELSEALAAKTVLLHEVDHRVKNNLQMIASLLALQTRTVADPAARAVMESMLKRVEALGTVQRRLYQSNTVERFDVTELVRDLAADLVRASGRDDIRLHVDAEAVEIAVGKGPPLALIVNELVSNALRHAFPDGRPGRLSIAIAPEGTSITIRIGDDGVGMPAPAETAGKRSFGKRSFGKRLIETLARQLNAEIAWHAADPGTVVHVRLPRDTAVSSETR